MDRCGDRQAFPDTTVLEIRPQRSLRRNDGALGGAKDLLGFTAMHIDSWIEQGYHDTMSALDSVRKPLQPDVLYKFPVPRLKAVWQRIPPRIRS